MKQIISLCLFLSASPALALSYACNSLVVDGEYQGDIKVVVDPDLALVTKIGFGDIQEILSETSILSYGGDDLLFSRKEECVSESKGGEGDSKEHTLKCRSAHGLEANFRLSMNDGRSSGRYEGLVYNETGNLYRFHLKFDGCRKVVP